MENGSSRGQERELRHRLHSFTPSQEQRREQCPPAAPRWIPARAGLTSVHRIGGVPVPLRDPPAPSPAALYPPAGVPHTLGLSLHPLSGPKHPRPRSRGAPAVDPRAGAQSHRTPRSSPPLGCRGAPASEVGPFPASRAVAAPRPPAELSPAPGQGSPRVPPLPGAGWAYTAPPTRPLPPAPGAATAPHRPSAAAPGVSGNAPCPLSRVPCPHTHCHGPASLRSQLRCATLPLSAAFPAHPAASAPIGE